MTNDVQKKFKAFKEAADFVYNRLIRAKTETLFDKAWEEFQTMCNDDGSHFGRPWLVEYMANTWMSEPPPQLMCISLSLSVCIT